MAPRYRAPLPADAGGPFVNGAEKANGRPTLGRPLVLHSCPPRYRAPLPAVADGSLDLPIVASLYQLLDLVCWRQGCADGTVVV